MKSYSEKKFVYVYNHANGSLNFFPCKTLEKAQKCAYNMLLDLTENEMFRYKEENVPELLKNIHNELSKFHPEEMNKLIDKWQKYLISVGQKPDLVNKIEEAEIHKDFFRQNNRIHY